MAERGNVSRVAGKAVSVCGCVGVLSPMFGNKFCDTVLHCHANKRCQIASLSKFDLPFRRSFDHFYRRA